MKDKINVTLLDIDQSIEYTIWDLILARSFYFVLFKIITPLQKDKIIRKSYSATLWSLRWSLDIAYIVTLYKLFDRRGLGLIKLIDQLKNLSELDNRSVNIKKYKRFKSRVDEYIEAINFIEPKLNILRNKFRAHHFPERKGYDIPLYRTKRILKFVEIIYDEIGSILRIPGFGSYIGEEEARLRFELEHFLKIIIRTKKKDKTKKYRFWS